MKKAGVTGLMVIFLVSFGYKLSGQEATDFKKLEWMAGTWKKTNGQPGETGQEKWERISETEWQGSGFSLRGKDTSFVERLRIIVKNKHIYYIADIPGNPEPVWYRFTEITNDGFTCENLEYDFPKRIEYHKTGNKIKATVSGDGKFIDYLFKKQKS
jgi:hypothetical protein